MKSSSPLTTSSLPLWVESYPTGYIDMKTQNISTFKKDVLKYHEAISSAYEIINNGDNSKIKMPKISNKVKKLKAATILSQYEEFDNFIQEESFLFNTNTYSHINPIWVLMAFLLMIWIIFLFAK